LKKWRLIWGLPYQDTCFKQVGDCETRIADFGAAIVLPEEACQVVQEKAEEIGVKERIFVKSRWTLPVIPQERQLSKWIERI